MVISVRLAGNVLREWASYELARNFGRKEVGHSLREYRRGDDARVSTTAIMPREKLEPWVLEKERVYLEQRRAKGFTDLQFETAREKRRRICSTEEEMEPFFAAHLRRADKAAATGFSKRKRKRCVHAYQRKRRNEEDAGTHIGKNATTHTKEDATTHIKETYKC